MLRLLILALLLYLLYRVVKGFFGTGERPGRNRNEGIIDDMVQDPCCKTYIPVRGAIRRVVAGKEYFFCGNACADKFQEEMENRSEA